MNKETRINKIKQIKDQGDILFEQEIPWKNSLKIMQAYKVPLDCLVYNQYNGRILSRTKSLETSRGQQLNPEEDKDKEIIEELLWDSKAGKNKETKKNLEKYGQIKVGIITKDGVIIDGNRRAMLLNKLKERYFKAIILPVTSDGDSNEIKKLETFYQMGEDSKLEYNAIEKYLKVDQLKKQDISTEEIASLMGESKRKIEKYINVFSIMKEYLKWFEYDNMFVQLDNREDLFINLNKWMQEFNAKNSAKAFDGYKDTDVDHLKYISFDYIRSRYEGKQFRILAEGNKDEHFFGDKDIWTSFKDKHFENVPQPKKYDFDYRNIDYIDLQKLQSDLNSIDDIFIEKYKDFLVENLESHRERIGYKKYKNAPEKLVKKAKDALEEAKNNKNINKENVLDSIEPLGELINDILQKSPTKSLENILKTLQFMSFEEDTNERFTILPILKSIQKEVYRLEKDIKKSVAQVF